MVIVYSDDKKLTFELLSKGSELAKGLGKKLTAVIIGKADDNLAKEYISFGADNVFIAETSMDSFKAEEYTDILGNIVRKQVQRQFLLVLIRMVKNLHLVLQVKLMLVVLLIQQIFI